MAATFVRAVAARADELGAAFRSGDFLDLDYIAGLSDGVAQIIVVGFQQARQLTDQAKDVLHTEHGQSLINDAQAIIDSAIPATPLREDTRDLIGNVQALVQSGDLSDDDGDKLIKDLDKAIDDFGKLDLEKGAENLEKFIAEVAKLIDNQQEAVAGDLLQRL